MDLKKYADKMIDISLLCIAMIVPVIFYTRTNDVFEINKLLVFKFFMLVIVAMWVFAVLKEKRFAAVKTNFDFPVLGYLAVCVLTTVITRNFFLSVYGVYEDFEGIITMFFYILLYYVTVNFIKKTGAIYKIMTGMLVATFIISAYGLAQNFGWDFIMWNPETYSKERFFSTLGNPNFLAAYLVETIPIIFIMFFITHKISKKVLILVALMAAITVLFLTKSRAGFISFFLTIFLIIAYSVVDSRKPENELFSKNKGWFVLFGVFIILTFFIPKVEEAFTMLWARSKSLFTLHGITLTPRLYIWESALMMYRDNPVLGTGLDTFQVIFPYYRFPIYWQLEWNGTPEKTHNIFLQVLATQGIVGMSVFLLMFTAFFKKSFNLIFGEKDIKRRYLVFAVFMAVLGYIIQGLFNYTVVAYGTVFWMALGLVISLDTAPKRFFARDFSAGLCAFIDRNRGTIYAVVAVLTLVCSVALIREWMADMYFKVGNIAVAAEKDDVAAPYYGAAVGLNPNCEIYWVKYGIAYEKLMRKENNPQKKLEYINAATGIHNRTIKMNPWNGYNYNNLARVYKHYGETLDAAKYDDSIRLYNEALNRDPNNAYFALDLATVYINKQDWQKAEEVCLKYIQTYPDFAVPYSYLGYIYMLQGRSRIKDALYYYEKAADNRQWFRDQTTELSTYSNLAILYVNLNMPDKAAEMFERVVRAKPDYKEGYLNLSKLYTLMKKYDLAAENYEKVLQLDPADTRASIPLEELKKRLKK